MLLKIFIRDDLNMRRGKMASQCAHAGLKYFLDICELNKNELSMNDDSLNLFRKWLISDKKIEVLPVQSEYDMKELISKYNGNCVSIEDLGRTEFKGVRTITSLAVIEEVNYSDYFNGEIQKVNELSKKNNKQAIVANKKIKMDKFKFSEQVVLVSILSVLGDFKNNEKIKIKSDNMKDWIEENFAKITLQAKPDEIFSLLINLRENNDINFMEIYSEKNELFMVAIGGDKAECVDKYTSDFKLF